MENLVTASVPDQELRVGDENKAGFVASLPRSPFDHAGRKNLTDDGTKALDARASAANVIVAPFRNVENLKKDRALARVLELEEDQERTFFEMGAVLSMIQKRKWFDPCASFDEWVEKNTAMSRAKARALIQIYDVIVKSGLRWAGIQHIEWTKLRAIASVLNEKTADYWIEVASNHSKAEVAKLVREYSSGSAKQKHGTQTHTQVKTFRLQIHRIQAAIEKAKKLTGAAHDSAALEVICQDYVEGRTTITESALVNILVGHLNTLDKDDAAEIMQALREQVRHAL